jgi:hypothetical protein
VSKVIALIFQSIKGLIFDTPTGTPGPHDVVHVVFGNFQVGYPTETGGLVLLVVDLPVLEKIDQEVLYSLIETAKANNLEPYAYLRYIFDKLPFASVLEDYEALLPWNVTSGRLGSVPPGCDVWLIRRLL